MNLITKTEIALSAREKNCIFKAWTTITDMVDAIPDEKEIIEINPLTGEVLEEISKDELKQVRETLLKLVRAEHDNLVIEVW